MKAVARLCAAALLLGACRPESRAEVRPPPAPPVDSPNAIPDAPVNGTIRGAPFVVRDARYVVDRRVGYAHTDIVLSSGQAESPCSPPSPARATSVWLRLEGGGAVQPGDLRFDSSKPGPWSVHYQAYAGEHWTGVGEGSAVFSIRDVTADGRLTGGLAVCFPDDEKSCVSGSFDALSCPTTLDQPVRGAVAAEAIPAKYLKALRGMGDAGVADAAR